jgi:hypothetical protein
LLGLSVVVPYEAQYPLYFLAEYKTKDYFVRNPVLQTSYYGGALRLDVLAKDSPSAPWRLTFSTETGSANATPPTFLNVTTLTHAGSEDGADGPSATVLTGPITKVPDLLAAYYQAWNDTGKAPPHTPILSGPYTSQMGAQIASGGGQGALSDGNHYFKYWKEDVAATGVWSFGVRLSSTAKLDPENPFLMQCFSLEVANDVTPGPNEKTLVQRASEIDWGPGLAPGVYSRIVQSTVHNSCVVTNGKAYLVIGYGEGDTYSTTGTMTKGNQA